MTRATLAGAQLGSDSMHPRERVIRDRFSGLACAHCGTLYAPAAIVVLARRRTKWMVLACCHSCERQAIFVVTFPPSQLNSSTPPQVSAPNASLHSSCSDLAHALDDQPPPDPNPDARPITDRDVDAMHDFLVRFDGDFQSLFSHTRRRLADDSSS